MNANITRVQSSVGKDRKGKELIEGRGKILRNKAQDNHQPKDHSIRNQ